MSEESLDQTKIEAFGEKLIQILNHGAVGLMISIGHRTGLFDTMAQMTPATSEEIARRAELNERYVREWLATMVTARIVDYDADNSTYYLSREHAALLTRAAAPDNVAVFAQYISVMGTVEDQVVEAFTHGDGVPYSAYKRFHVVMAEDSGQTIVAALHDHILPLVPGLKERLVEGIDVLDIGCGSGRAMNLLAASFPNSRFTGYDFSEECIAAARAESEQCGSTNIHFEVKDVAELGEASVYDLITAFDAIHDQPKPAQVLQNIQSALRPDATFLMQDVAGSSYLHKNLDHPTAPFLYTISCMHCMSVSLAAGGPGLGAMWGKETALDMLGEAGFSNVRVEQLSHDPFNYFYIMTKADKGRSPLE